MDPRNESTLSGIVNRGVQFMRRGQFSDADTCFTEAVQLSPTCQQAWFNKGIVQENLENLGLAIECYEHALAINPSIFIGKEDYLGVRYMQANRYREARYWLKKSIHSGKGNIFIQGEYEKCCRLLDGPLQVFISYPWKERAFVRTVLLPTLAQEDIPYFLDQERIPQEKEMDYLPWQLQQAIGLCDVILIVWSKFSEESHWVSLEISSAVAMLKGVLIVTVGADPVPSRLKETFADVKFVSSRELSDDRKRVLLPSIMASGIDADSIQRYNTLSEDIREEVNGEEFVWVPLRGGPITDFQIGKYPITQAQWTAVMGSNPARHVGDSTRPIECVSWHDVQRFVAKLNSLDCLHSRLPADVEWEYACRAGSLSNWCFGDDCMQLPEYAWCVLNTGEGFRDGEVATMLDEDALLPRTIEVSSRHTNSVFSKRPNRWGLHHMHGNVSEWCHDDCLRVPGNKVARGGSFLSGDRETGCSFHMSRPADCREEHVGFRLCRSC